jgi:hypothetical protein
MAYRPACFNSLHKNLICLHVLEPSYFQEGSNVGCFEVTHEVRDIQSWIGIS